jgi:hypothetical protein
MFVIDSRPRTGDRHRGRSLGLDRCRRRGHIELEIVALDLNDAIVVVHVMPTALRRR